MTGGASFLILRERPQNQVADAALCAHIDDRPQERERAPFAVHRVLARRECDIASAAAPSFPDRESDEFQAGERPVGEVQFSLGEFPRRVATVVGCDFDSHVIPAFLSRDVCREGGWMLLTEARRHQRRIR